MVSQKQAAVRDRKKTAKAAVSHHSCIITDIEAAAGPKANARGKPKGKGKAPPPPPAPVDSRFNSDSEDGKMAAPEELFDDSDEDMEPIPSAAKGKQRATDDEVDAPENPSGKVKGRKGKAGGTGKKGKKFVEARVSRHSLAS
jgi:hypothetical protein